MYYTNNAIPSYDDKSGYSQNNQFPKYGVEHEKEQNRNDEARTSFKYLSDSDKNSDGIYRG